MVPRVGGSFSMNLAPEDTLRGGINVERRTAQGLGPDRWNEGAREVVSLKPDVIVAFTFALADEFKSITASIPIVAGVLDPVEYGLVRSLARPDANVTGVTADIGPAILGKQLDLLMTAA